jgi:hypothetical protein
MAATKGTFTRILVDEYDFSGVSNSVEVAVSSEGLDVTAFQDLANVYIPGVQMGMITQAGYFTGASANGFESEFYDRLGSATGVTVSVLFGTNVVGCPAYVVPGTNGRAMTISAPVNGVITLNGSWGEGTGIKRGRRLFGGTISATGAQTAIDFGAAGSAGGFAYLHVQAITGSASSATITVQSSSDNSTFANEGTFTFSSVGVQAITMASTVNRYIRLNCTSLGGATNFTVVGIACVTGVKM